MFDIYIRVSRLGDRSEAEATKVYEEQCREWAATNDLIVDEVEEDTDVSGSRPTSRRSPPRPSPPASGHGRTAKAPSAAR